MSSLPTFIVIGPGRSGSTMLYEAFKEHPEISVAKNIKETNFFNHNYHKGIEWYKSFFKENRHTKAIGEISNRYISDTRVPQRIAQLLPQVKLITVLRNPFERIRSAYAFRQRVGAIDPDINILDAIIQFPSLISGNYYADHLERFLNFFPEENLHIAFYEDLVTDPERFIREIFTFIGVNDLFIPRALNKQVNPSAIVRLRFLAYVIRKMADTLRWWHLYFILDKLKSSNLVRALMFKRGVKLEDSETSRQLNTILIDHFFPQIANVEKITGRDLSHWYVGRKSINKDVSSAIDKILDTKSEL